MNDIVIITGGTSGLGFELVKQSLEKGLTVCNIDKDTEKMSKLDNDFKGNYNGFCEELIQTFIKIVEIMYQKKNKIHL